MPSQVAQVWSKRLRKFAGPWLAAHPLLGPLAGQAVIILHGSTTRGVDDPVSDLDLWLIVPQKKLKEFTRRSPITQFEFALNGKPGHFNLEAQESIVARITQCDFPLIAELRRAKVLQDSRNWGAKAIARARRVMPPEVRRAWFCHHYLEMRSEHRACDNPLARGDAVAVLLALTCTLEHAMQAAMVLDGVPYSYSKWLAQDCRKTPTGRRIMPGVQEILELLGKDALHLGGPERTHPLNLKLREIRQILIEAARHQGLDEPWLKDWYLYLSLRNSIHKATWPA